METGAAACAYRPDSHGSLMAYARLFYAPHEGLRLRSGMIPGHRWRSAQRFCTGSTPLAASRHSRHVSRASDLTCRMCGCGAHESELHFFFYCPAYAHLRMQFPTIFPTAGSHSAAADCMRAAFSLDNLSTTGRFLDQAFRLRTSVLHASTAATPTTSA